MSDYLQVTHEHESGLVGEVALRSENSFGHAWYTIRILLDDSDDVLRTYRACHVTPVKVPKKRMAQVRADNAKKLKRP
jgi:hypothetical protein